MYGREMHTMDHQQQVRSNGKTEITCTWMYTSIAAYICIYTGIAACTACMQTQIHMQLVIRGIRLPAPCFCKGDHCSNRTTECTLWNCPLLLNASDVWAILYGYVCATKY